MAVVDSHKPYLPVFAPASPFYSEEHEAFRSTVRRFVELGVDDNQAFAGSVVRYGGHDRSRRTVLAPAGQCCQRLLDILQCR